ncbi:MAG: hypothetical protein WDO16_10260 [Bacteroidota bacterium]
MSKISGAQKMDTFYLRPLIHCLQVEGWACSLGEMRMCVQVSDIEHVPPFKAICSRESCAFFTILIDVGSSKLRQLPNSIIAPITNGVLIGILFFCFSVALSFAYSRALEGFVPKNKFPALTNPKHYHLQSGRHPHLVFLKPLLYHSYGSLLFERVGGRPLITFYYQYFCGSFFFVFYNPRINEEFTADSLDFKASW